MSEKHDHSHDHDHDHGHHHDHDHDHGHKAIDLPLKKAPAPAPEPVPEPIQEDAGSMALAEALRSSFAIVKVLMIILVIAFFASGIFTVSSQQRAILLRFGKPVGTGPEQLLGPGLHWSFPAPIDEVVRIPIGEIQVARSTAGWYATTPEAEAAGAEPPPTGSLSPASEGYTITSDGNIIHARATIRYRITDPLKYLLGFTQASNVVQNIVDESLFFASSQFTVDEALTANRQGFQERVLARIRQLAEDRDLGITIELGDVQVIPPRFIKQAFDDALGAEIERRKKRDEATSYAASLLSTAEGDANSILNAGQTEKTREIQSVLAQAQYFKDQLPHYKENPQLYMARVQTEAIGRIMTNVQDKIFLPERADGKARELRLLLNREPPKPVAPQDQPQQQNR